MRFNVDFNEEIARIIKKFKGDVGCIVIFVGVAKRKNKNKGVVCDVNWKEVNTIKENLKNNHNILYLDIKINSGELKIGDLITTIFIAAYDRKSAFKACRECIDEIKKRGVKKKEIF